SLSKKSRLITDALSQKESFEDSDYIRLIRLCFPAKRYADSIVQSTEKKVLESAFKSLRNSRNEPEDVVHRFQAIRGCPPEVAWDLAAELLHFVNPDRYGLATRWVWNPEKGTGALSSVFARPYRKLYTEMQAALSELNSRVTSCEHAFTGFYGLTVMCALAYAGNIIGTKDSAINSGGMEALFPDSGTLALMMLGLGRLSYAHT
ncbi:MAG: hypothetical protein QW767_02585, partial [Thermoprotei archaeon]